MNEQVLDETPPLGKIYIVLFKNVKEIYEEAIGLIQMLKSINDVKIKDELIAKELEVMQTVETAEKIEAELENTKNQLVEVAKERDQYKARMENLQQQLDQLKGEYDTQEGQLKNVQDQLVQEENKVIHNSHNVQEFETLRQEIDDLKHENDGMMKILIKQSKREITGKGKDFNLSGEKLREPSSKILHGPGDKNYGNQKFSNLDSKESKSKSLFIQPTGKQVPIGKTREKILTLNQVRYPS